MKHTFHRAAPRYAKGVVLPLALVMLVMVTLLAVAGLRGVTTEERIAANLKASAIAFERAEATLRDCEAIVRRGDLEEIAKHSYDPGEKPTRTPNYDKGKKSAATAGSGLKDSECVIQETAKLFGRTEQKRQGGGPPRSNYTSTARATGDPAGNFEANVQSQIPPFNL
jgi:hypothetical protein